MPHPNDVGHGRPARMVFWKTGETPVPPGLCRPGYFPNHTRRARVQGLPTNLKCFQAATVISVGFALLQPDSPSLG